MERIFVPDGNWYLHRAFYTLHTNRPVEEALPYHLLSMICKDAVATKSRMVCAAFDGPKVFRYKVYPEYKAHRNGVNQNTDAENAPPSGDVYDYLPFIYELFDKVGLQYFQPRIHEADDVLCSVAHAYHRKYNVLCGTADKDAHQYLLFGDRVKLYNSINKNKVTKKPEPIYITAADVEKKHGVKVEQLVDYQTLIGDLQTDNIPPIKGYGPKKAADLLREHGSLQAWFKQSTGDERAFIRSQVENLRRNRKLVELLKDAVPPAPPSEWKISKVKPKGKFPQSFHDLHTLTYPKTKGLF